MVCGAIIGRAFSPLTFSAGFMGLRPMLV